MLSLGNRATRCRASQVAAGIKAKAKAEAKAARAAAKVARAAMAGQLLKEIDAQRVKDSIVKLGLVPICWH